MTYTLRLSHKARADLNAIFDYIAAHNPKAAATLIDKILVAIETLQRFPNRAPLAYENAHIATGARHVLVGNYRIVYTVTKKDIVILTVRHAKRQQGLQ